MSVIGGHRLSSLVVPVCRNGGYMKARSCPLLKGTGFHPLLSRCAGMGVTPPHIVCANPGHPRQLTRCEVMKPHSYECCEQIPCNELIHWYFLFLSTSRIFLALAEIFRSPRLNPALVARPLEVARALCLLFFRASARRNFASLLIYIYEQPRPCKASREPPCRRKASFTIICFYDA